MSVNCAIGVVLRPCLLQVGFQVPPELIGLGLQINLRPQWHPMKVSGWEFGTCQSAIKLLPSKAVEMQTWCQNQEKRGCLLLCNMVNMVLHLADEALFTSATAA